jgi:hypothetical protein
MERVVHRKISCEGKGGNVPGVVRSMFDVAPHAEVYTRLVQQTG